MAQNQIETIKSTTNAQIEKVKKAVEQFPIMVEKSERAKMALTAIKKIGNDQEDQETEKILVKVRKTYELIKDLRTNITGPLDELKKNLMIPEKAISTLAAEKDSEYNRVKALRDKYANDKYLQQKQEEERIAKERESKRELSELEAAINKNIFNGIVDALYNLDQSVDTYLKDISLENFEEKEKRLKLTPKLKIEVYESWFSLPFKPQHCSNDQIESLINDLKTKHDYDQMNLDYVNRAKDIMKNVIDTLPGIKKNLQDLAKLEKENAAEAEKMRKQQEADANAEREKKQREAEEEKRKKEEEIDLEARNKQLDAEFDAQVELQSQEKLKNVRTSKKAVINCKPAAIAQVFSKVLFACFSHPDFPGYLKKDKSGNALPPDENGVPQYADWADHLLKFYANHSDMKIDGIDIKEVISTIQKK